MSLYTENDINFIRVNGETKDKFWTDWKSFFKKLGKSSKKNHIIALDGYYGVDWSVFFDFFNDLKNENIPLKVINIRNIFKEKKFAWKKVEENLIFDKHFGRVFKGDIEDFLDTNKLESLKKEIEEFRKNNEGFLFIVGEGAFNKKLEKSYDFVIYIDLTREKFLQSLQNNDIWLVDSENLKDSGAADVGLSISAFKFSQYILTPIFDKHRRKLLKKMNYYVLLEETPKIMDRKFFEDVNNELASKPFKLKPLYIQGPWGGQWIKKIRKLGDDYKVCAWAFEAVTMDMGLLVNVNDILNFELPFSTFLAMEKEKIMGEKTFKRFKYFFPIRIHYDDSYDGDNMAIQVHPNKNYVKKNFNEEIGQHEAYYIIKRKKDAGVFLGINENINIKEFYEQARKAEVEKVPLDYKKYIAFHPSKEGDLFLIPAGTVHALGKNQVCLEIGTSYGYTFHIYDYLRPDLKGNLREIHLNHAFNSLKTYRDKKWVKKSLIPNPIEIRKYKNSKELLLGRRREMIFEVRRLEIDEEWKDNTNDKFHILVLVKGKKAKIFSKKDKESSVDIDYTRTIIIPANFGEYFIKCRGKATFVKVLVSE